jgi:hypothetical protein
MASHVLHLSFAFRVLGEGTIPEVHRSAFMLGALAPDMVASHREKRHTHYSVHAGITWGYRFRAFERAFASYGERSPVHRWFRDGYRYHLRLDDLWMRTCGHRALLRMMPRLPDGRDAVLAAYYAEMSALDNYACARFATESIERAILWLQRADLNVLPPWIVREQASQVLAQVVQRAQMALVSRTRAFEGRYIRRSEAERFLRRAAAVLIA